MEEHPIEGLMITAMNSIEDMVDVNTIIGEPISAGQDTTIIPISKVCFGFAAGGSEFKGETVDEYSKKEKEEMIQYRLPFGGGSGAGVSISPVAFLVVQGENVKLLPVNHSSALDKLLDYVPDLFDKVNEAVKKIKPTASGEQKVNQESTINTRKKQKRRNNTTYEFNYENKKPEAYQDEEIEEYEEQMDD
jgi:sporulation protein YtfJ